MVMGTSVLKLDTGFSTKIQAGVATTATKYRARHCMALTVSKLKMSTAAILQAKLSTVRLVTFATPLYHRIRGVAKEKLSVSK